MSHLRTRLMFVLCLLLSLTFLPAGLSAKKSSPHSAEDMLVIEGTGPAVQPDASLNVQLVVDSHAIIDFDGDDLADLPIGSPFKDFSAIRDAGSVNVVYSRGEKGLTRKRNQQFIIDGIEGDNSGNALGVGDFNGDKVSDIAVGSQGADGPLFGSNRGGIVIFLGKKGGGFQRTQSFFGDKAGDRLGYAVTSGDYNGDGFFDLAASAVGRGFGAKINVGLVYTWRGSSSGLIRDQDWHLGTAGIKGRNRANTFFGSSLFSADVNHDLKWDLLIGSPFGKAGRGFANIIYGGSNFLGADGSQQVSLVDKTKASFAYSISGCYCNNDLFADPIFGAPDYQNGTGAAFRLFGSGSGVTGDDSQFIQSASPQPGGKFGFTSAAAGISARWMMAFGSPFEDVNVDSRDLVDGGAVDVYSVGLDFKAIFKGRYLAEQLGSRRNSGDQLGRNLAVTIDEKRLTLAANMPGADVSGLDNAGAVITWKASYSSADFKLKYHQTFDLGGLKGNPEINGAFGLGLPAIFLYDRD